MNGIKFWCYHAGHVLGAAMFMIEIAGVKVIMADNYFQEWLSTSIVLCDDLSFRLQLSPDSSNPQGKLKKVQGSLSHQKLSEVENKWPETRKNVA